MPARSKMDLDIQNIIQGNLNKIRSHKGKLRLRNDVLYPSREKEKDLAQVKAEIERLEKIHAQAKNYVKDIRTYVPDITDQSAICAAYLIYGKVIRSWEAIFVLAKEGRSFEMMELTRSIRENLDLIALFHLDIKNSHLTKWLKGETLTNKVAREFLDKYSKTHLGKLMEELKLSMLEISVNVYRGLSKYSHCSYVVLLENIDPFTEDFDWNGYANAHYTAENLRLMTKGAMAYTLITLKMTLQVVGEMGKREEIDKLLVESFGKMGEHEVRKQANKIKGG